MHVIQMLITEIGKSRNPIFQSPDGSSSYFIIVEQDGKIIITQKIISLLFIRILRYFVLIRLNHRKFLTLTILTSPNCSFLWLNPIKPLYHCYCPTIFEVQYLTKSSQQPSHKTEISLFLVLSLVPLVSNWENKGGVAVKVFCSSKIERFGLRD